MEYKTIFWTHSSDSSIVFQLPKKIIRIMTGSKPRDSCNTIFQTLEILTVPSQYFCGRSPSEIVGRIQPGAWMCCLLCVLCVVRYRSLRQINQSSRGVLPTVARRRVWSRNLENEEAKAHYRVVKNTTTQGCNAKKTNKTNHLNIYHPWWLFWFIIWCISLFTLQFTVSKRQGNYRNTDH